MYKMDSFCLICLKNVSKNRSLCLFYGIFVVLLHILSILCAINKSNYIEVMSSMLPKNAPQFYALSKENLDCFVI